MTLVAFSKRAELPRSVDVRCASLPVASGDDRVAVLEYRAGRRVHRRAFVAPDLSAADVGRRVLANHKLCQLRTDQ